MTNRVELYRLIREHDQKVMFSGSYVKYYLGTPFCAIFEEYPSEQTTIQVCKRLPDDTRDFKYLRCVLMSMDMETNQPKASGTFLIMREVKTEKEATAVVKANSQTAQLLQGLQ